MPHDMIDAVEEATRQNASDAASNGTLAVRMMQREAQDELHAVIAKMQAELPTMQAMQAMQTMQTMQTMVPYISPYIAPHIAPHIAPYITPLCYPTYMLPRGSHYPHSPYPHVPLCTSCAPWRTSHLDEHLMDP